MELPINITEMIIKEYLKRDYCINHTRKELPINITEMIIREHHKKDYQINHASAIKERARNLSEVISL